MMQARIVGTAPEATPSEAIVLPVLEGRSALDGEVGVLDRRLRGALSEVIRRPGAGKILETTLIRGGEDGGPSWILLVGVGTAAQLDLVRLRNALQGAGRVLRRYGVRRAAVVATSPLKRAGGVADLARALTEGIALANFDAGVLKTAPDAVRPPIAALGIIGLDGGAGAAAAVRQGLVLGDATNLARRWINLPANALTPTIFVEKVRQALPRSGLELRVLELADMRRLRMGALLAVARGSEEPPKLIVLRYHGGGRRAGRVLGLVGKGITFDSGGISIKPADGMAAMKSDMGGGAAVVSAMLAIATLKPKIDVIGVVPATENMPSGKAARPGDVVTASNGKTIEIINTDAEGRLVLADGLTYAIQQGATHLVDIATLTGSMRRTMGPVSTGAFSNDPALMAQVRRAAELAGERVWEMPMWPDYDGLVTSEVADLKNAFVPWAAATTAAIFLREFVDSRPWVHLDIAGSAVQDAVELKAIPRGPTGAGVRLLAHLAGLLAGDSAVT